MSRPLPFAALFFAACATPEEPTPSPPIVVAARSGDVTRVDALATAGASAADLSQALNEAVAIHSLTTVEALLGHGAHPTPKTINAAAEVKAPGLFRRIAEHVDFPVSDNVFVSACETLDVAVIQRLVKFGANTNAQISVLVPKTRISESSSGGDAAVSWAFERRADGPTALSTALSARKPDTVAYLLSEGADPNMRFTSDSNGHSYPIVLAVEMADEACVRELMNAGADPFSQDSQGRTADILAANSPAIQKLLRGRD